VTISETLAKLADELEAHPEHWTQGHYARDSRGVAVTPDSREAVCWCMKGLFFREAAALLLPNYRVTWHVTSLSDHVRSVLRRKGFLANVSAYNDNRDRTVTEVIETLREAAKEAA